MESKNKYYLSLHVETTGINYDSSVSIADGHDIIALAAAVCEKETFKEIDSTIIFFDTDIKNDDDLGTQYHDISVDFLKENGVDEETGIEQFFDFITDYFFIDYSIITLGQNTHAFTLPFIKQLLYKHDVYLNFSVCSMDVFSITVIALGETSISELISIFGDADDLMKDQQNKEYKCLLKVKTFIEIFRRMNKIWDKIIT